MHSCNHRPRQHQPHRTFPSFWKVPWSPFIVNIPPPPSSQHWAWPRQPLICVLSLYLSSTCSRISQWNLTERSACVQLLSLSLLSVKLTPYQILKQFIVPIVIKIVLWQHRNKQTGPWTRTGSRSDSKFEREFGRSSFHHPASIYHHVQASLSLFLHFLPLAGAKQVPPCLREKNSASLDDWCLSPSPFSNVIFPPAHQGVFLYEKLLSREGFCCQLLS